MSFSRLNKEDAIRKYLTGELSSEEHITVGDLIQSDPDWRLAYERYQRVNLRHLVDFGSSDSVSTGTASTPSRPQAVPTARPQRDTNKPGWLNRFLKTWGIWIAVYLFFKFAPSIVGFFRDLRDRARGGQDKTPKTENMIATDLAARYGKPDDEMASLIETCTQRLAKAEKYYQDGRMQRYVDVLLSVGLDENEPCRDEALFLASSAAVDNGDTDLALNLVAEISDLDHFNADVQWIIAKAFVVNAKRGTTPLDKAKRAVDKAMAFPENAKYRQEADEMLSALGSDI